MSLKTRQEHNASMLAKMSPSIRESINIILDDMEAAGWQPKIDSGVYRSPEEQAKKVKQGVSKVYYSYHNVTDPGDKPASLAADITDVRYGWSASCPKEFWLQLAICAHHQGLQTGIFFGLGVIDRLKIHTAIALKNAKANVPLGWDTAHVQPLQWKLSLSKVKAGKRPNLTVKPGLFARKNPILVLNGSVIEGAYFYGGHWYALTGKVAEAVGARTEYPSVTCPVGAQLTKWGLKYVWNDRIKSRGRFDIRTVKE